MMSLSNDFGFGRFGDFGSAVFPIAAEIVGTRKVEINDHLLHLVACNPGTVRTARIGETGGTAPQLGVPVHVRIPETQQRLYDVMRAAIERVVTNLRFDHHLVELFS